MAKAKKSRRARRQQAAKQKQSAVSRVTADKVEPTVEEAPSEPVESISPPVAQRRVVDYARDYYYVYTELRNILITAVVMFLIMVGLAFLF